VTPAPRSRAWLAASLIFLLGIAVGTAATVVVGAAAIRRALRAPVAASGFIDRALNRTYTQIDDSVALTPQEAALTRAELRDLAEKIKTIRLESAARFSTEASASIERIAAGLPPEKQAAFRRLAAERFPRLGLTQPASSTK
jgi:hypothetical protein